MRSDDPQRPRRYGAKGVVVLLYVIGVVLLFSHGVPIQNNVDIPVSQDFIQDEINSYLAKNRTFHGVEAEHVTFTLNNNVDVLAELHGTKVLRKFTMVIHTVGQPDYSLSKQGKIFYKAQKIEIVDFQWNGTPPGEALTKLRDRYTKPNGLVNKVLTDVAPHVEAWAQELGEKAGIALLQHIPIFDLNKHWYGYYFGGALKSITVQGNTMVASFSLIGMTMIVIAAIAMLIGAIGLTFTLAIFG